MTQGKLYVPFIKVIYNILKNPKLLSGELGIPCSRGKMGIDPLPFQARQGKKPVSMLLNGNLQKTGSSQTGFHLQVNGHLYPADPGSIAEAFSLLQTADRGYQLIVNHNFLFTWKQRAKNKNRSINTLI